MHAADAHTHLADFALSHRVVGVVTDLRRQIEGHRQAALAFFQQEAIARVGLLGGGIPGVLAHRPQATAIHGRLYPACVREFARKT